MIYLDHFASSPLSSAAADAVREALGRAHANPSSVHAAGRSARSAIERAREALARAIGAAPTEIVWTSGGTEAVHLAIAGAAGDVRTVFEDRAGHPSLRAACERVARERGAVLEPVPMDPGGEPALDALGARLASVAGPALVAVSWVQHETGAIAPVTSLSALVAAHGGRLVLDAVQALGRLPVDVASTGAVAAAFSGHKVGGPPGAGAVWFAPGLAVAALQRGGGQERGLRAGAENTLGVVGFGAAAGELATRWLDAAPRIAALRDRVERALAAIPGTVVNGAGRERVAHACHASVQGLAGAELVAALDLEGFCVASGPACSSGRPDPSASMVALYPDEPWRARGALRVTLGPSTTTDEIDRLASVLPAIIARVRSG